jgi:5-methylcytosine-specific restriction endonuclease McrA
MRELGQHPFFEHTVAMGLHRYKNYKLAATFLFLESERIKSISPTYIIEFNSRVSRGTNNEESIKLRHQVLVRRFIEQYGPVELDEDKIFGYDQKLTIFRKYDGVCQECGRKLEFGDSHTHYHHIDPYIAGGQTEVENGLLVCQDCHLSKIHGSSKA